MNPKTVREFGFILAGFLLLFPLFANGLGMLFAAKPFHYWLGWPFLSATALLTNLFLLEVMSLVYRGAMWAGHGISWLMMRFVLGLLFYFVLSPIGITMRFLGKDILDQKIDRNASSYWKKRTVKRTRDEYERLF